MQRISKEIIYNHNNKANKPSAYVDVNETFVVETEISTGPWLKSKDDKWSPDKTLANNPCNVIYVNGAMPGDTLVVRIESITPGPLGQWFGSSNNINLKLNLAPYLNRTDFSIRHSGMNITNIQ